MPELRTPILECDGCKKPTPHTFKKKIGTNRLFFSEEDKPIVVKGINGPARITAHRYICAGCGSERTWGTE